ncbi:MAG: hypothetical protein KBE23_08100 [Chloroflexi bacterium]|nr:hypothetical protein [Chloroflexota bacterium]MBP7042692.1 hypothetical protein [Chloroflexota bacterium]
MKTSSSPLRALVLAMLMVILVLVALFWFLYRGWGPLEQQAQQADAQATLIVGLEGELRQNEARLTAVQAEGTAVASERDTAINNHQLAERELNDQQQQIDLLLTRVFTQETTIAGQSAAQSVPRVTIIEPVSGGVAQVNEPVSIVAVAADESGLALVLVARAGDVVTQTLAGETLHQVRMAWIPTAVGEYDIVITAVNTAQIASPPVSVTLQVVDTAAEMAAFTQTVADILGQPAAAMPGSEQQTLATDTGNRQTANRLFLRAFDFLPGGDVDVTLLNEYCSLPTGADFPLPPEPGSSVDARLAYIRAVVGQRQLASYSFADLPNADARAALCALAEGQIRLAQELYIAQADPALQAALQTSLADSQIPLPGNLPEIIAKQQAFPLAEGLAYAQALYEAGGNFGAVDAAWQQPPQSTAQILRPEAALAAPVMVTLPLLAAVLPPEWSMVDEGVVGEWLMGQYLSQRLDGETAVSAASGWRGDRYALYHNPTDEGLVTLWHVVWDSADEAAEFAAGYDSYLSNLWRTSGLEQLGTSNIRCWDGGLTGATCVYPAEVQSETETIIVRAMDKATAQEVLGFVLAEGLSG